MKKIAILIAAYARVFRADRIVVLLTFIVPIVMIALFGAIFGRSHTESSGIRLAFLNLSSAPVSVRVESILDTLKTFMLVRSMNNENGKPFVFDTTTIKEYVKRGDAPAALVIPADAYTDTSIGFKIRFYYDPRNEIEMQIVQGMLQKTIMEQIPQLFMESMKRQARQFLGKDRAHEFHADIDKTVRQYFPKANFLLDTMFDQTAASAQSVSGRTMTDTVQKGALDSGSFSNRADNIFKGMVDFQSTQLVGTEIANPNATRSVGGWAMMFLLFTLSGFANALIDERRNAVFLRILAAPFSYTHILWSRYIFGTLLGAVQLTVLFVAGSILFKIDIVSNAGNLFFVIVLSAAAATGFGMLLAAFSKSVAQAGALGMMLILAMSIVGGAWFPTSLMPAYIQAAGKLSLVYWSIAGFMAVLWRGSTFVVILPILAVLACFATLSIGVSLWKFSKTKLE